MSNVHSAKKLTDSKYLNLYELTAEKRDGTIFPYYMSSRVTDPNGIKAMTHVNVPNGVILYGVCGEKKDHVVLVRQYRYPIGGYIYEFPAGLVEPGENLVDAGVREMYEETGLTMKPVDAGEYSKPFFTTVGMTDESCGTVFGYCTGTPSNLHQEQTEDIEVVIADREECRRILKEENVAIMCAYMLMHFISTEGDPLKFLEDRK